MSLISYELQWLVNQYKSCSFIGRVTDTKPAGNYTYRQRTHKQVGLTRDATGTKLKPAAP